jgi:Cu-Zn family superoxide dismutase
VTVRSLAATATGTALLAAAGAVVLTAPALAGGADVARAGVISVYDPAQFPSTATARVHSTSTPSGRTVVTLTVTGLDANRTYGAHAHAAPCSSLAGAGPHWQRVKDPVKPSVNPAYANPSNEIWLDVTTNAAGNASAQAVQDFAFSPDDRPASVIIHAQPTAANGTAGARLACLTVEF